MPELPEVESIRVNLEKHILNQTIANVVVSNRKLRWPIQDNFEVLLQNHTVKALERRAKYILLSFKQSNFILVWHLGMSGRVQILTPKELVPRKVHDHVEIEFYSGLILRFHDPRRFGAMLLVPSQDLPSFSLLNSLGIEPFDDNFSSSLLLKLIKHKSLTLKTVLLNQKIVAGLGNIYVCEALHQAKLSPLRLAKTLSVLEAEALVKSIQEVLKKAIAAGGSTLRDHRQPNGSKGSFQENFKVYGREGEPCFQCNQSSIERIVQSNRSTFYCKECQK